MKKEKKRADLLLFEKGLCESRAKAQALIMAGKVSFLKNGRWEILKKAGDPLLPEVEFKVEADSDVGRGAKKLRGAFDHWTFLNAEGASALDIGSSTGGFTQVLLEKEAKKVVALDVGTNQLHERLRQDPRVVSIEQQHVLKIEASDWELFKVNPQFDFIVSDLSFISLTRVIPVAARWLKSQCYWVALLKPQFELDASKVPKGIVRKEEFRAEAIAKVKACVASSMMLEWVDLIDSPILGGEGNKEYLICLRKL